LSEADDAETTTARLESALDRLAALAARPRAVVANPAPSADQGDVVAAELAARLDGLIAQLRDALAG